MNKGTLSFRIDGENYNIAFKDSRLKKGPIFAAVALKGIAGFRYESGREIPKEFLLWF